MKPRARRVTIAAAVLGGAVVGVLVVAHWDTAWDHVEAWRFQRTHKTHTVTRASYSWSGDWSLSLGEFLCLLADRSGDPVIFDVVEASTHEMHRELKDVQTLQSADVSKILEEDGWRVIEQRFPRRAYVVIRDESLGVEEPTQTFPYPGILPPPLHLDESAGEPEDH